MYRGVYWRRGPVTMAAIGAVDVALWDIKGKAACQPVYQLLGGAVRDRILSYTHATGWDVPALLDSIDATRERGFRAIRVQTGVPGLDTVYGVSKAGAAYEPAGRGTAPVEEVWDTDAYLRHAPVALAAAREHVGVEVALLDPRRIAALAEVWQIRLGRTARPTSPRSPSRLRCTSAWPRRTSRSRST